jgi:chromosome segregation ATPase
LTQLAAVSKLAAMPKEDGTRDDGPYRAAEPRDEVDRLRAEVASLEERNANQVKAMNHGATLLQAAREERNAAIADLTIAREHIRTLQGQFAEENRRIAIALAEFGAQIERFRREAKENEETRLHLTSSLSSERSANEHLRASLEKIRVQSLAGYRDAALQERFDALWKENETLANKVVNEREDRVRAQNETARLTERWNRLGVQLKTLRSAVNAMAREVGVLRQKIAQDDHFHGLYLGDVDRAIEEALKAAAAPEVT